MDYETRLATGDLRQQTDPEVEVLFKTLLETESAQKTERTFLNFSKPETLSPRTQQLLSDYFERYGVLPSWADHQAMARGAAVYGEYGPQIVVSLFCNALPACYSCPNGAEVLARTGRMLRSDQEDFRRYTNRVMETAQFVMNVMAPSAFSDGSGVRTVLKIRLIHASIRHYLSNERFDAARYGAPINQQDLLGTLMSFSYLSLDTLEKLGVYLEQQQKDDFIHLWNVIGTLLGIDERLLPQTCGQAATATDIILSQQMAASEAGRLLTKSLVEFINDVLWRDWFNEFSPFMVRYLSGRKRAAILQVEDANPWLSRAAVPLMRVVMRYYQRIVRSHSLLNVWVQRESRKFLQALILYYAKEKQIEFKVPSDYKDRWQL